MNAAPTANPNLDRLREWSGPVRTRPEELADALPVLDDTLRYVSWIDGGPEPHVLFQCQFDEDHFPDRFRGQPLRASLKANPPTSYEQVVLHLTLFKAGLQPGNVALPHFEPDSLLDAILAETQGYIFYEYQLMHVLQLCFTNTMSYFLSRALRMSTAASWEVVNGAKLHTGLSLGDVFRERMPIPVHSVPPYPEALALWDLLCGRVADSL